MLKLSSEITIKGKKTWLFKNIVSCKITEDINTLTDTCELVLPQKISWQGAENGEIPIKIGDEIMVKLGYNDQLSTRFVGFIANIDTKKTLTIKAEDGMFQLKQKKLKPFAIKSASLAQVLDKMLEATGVEYVLIDKNLKVGNYRSQQPTVAQELQSLKERFMLSSYFRIKDQKNVLYTGFTYPTDGRHKYSFKHSKNIVEENFEEKVSEHIKAKVEAKSFDAKHKETKVEIGDTDGEVIKIRVDHLSKAELTEHAKQALDRFKQPGITGSFDTFGTPPVRKCDMVELYTSNKHHGVYLIKKNEISFGITGFRQKIEIGQTLSSY